MQKNCISKYLRSNFLWNPFQISLLDLKQFSEIILFLEWLSNLGIEFKYLKDFSAYNCAIFNQCEINYHVLIAWEYIRCVILLRHNQNLNHYCWFGFEPRNTIELHFSIYHTCTNSFVSLTNTMIHCCSFPNSVNHLFIISIKINWIVQNHWKTINHRWWLNMVCYGSNL